MHPRPSRIRSRWLVPVGAAVVLIAASVAAPVVAAAADPRAGDVVEPITGLLGGAADGTTGGDRPERISTGRLSTDRDAKAASRLPERPAERRRQPRPSRTDAARAPRADQRAPVAPALTGPSLIAPGTPLPPDRAPEAIGTAAELVVGIVDDLFASLDPAGGGASEPPPAPPEPATTPAPHAPGGSARVGAAAGASAAPAAPAGPTWAATAAPGIPPASAAPVPGSPAFPQASRLPSSAAPGSAAPATAAAEAVGPAPVGGPPPLRYPPLVADSFTGLDEQLPARGAPNAAASDHVTTWLLGFGGTLLFVAGAASLAYVTVWRSSE